MNAQDALKTLARWSARGEFEEDRVLHRIDEEIREYNPIPKEQEINLRAHFKTPYLSEEDFASILQQKVILSDSVKRIEAERTIFVMLVYLSDFPFPSQPSDFTGLHTRLISQEQLIRSLIWLIPGNYTYITKSSSYTRVRTPADRRRLIFQSLASAAISDTVINPTTAYERAKQNANDFPPDYAWKVYAGVNYDEDGDEIFHDMLDVLFAVQTQPNPLIRPVRRNMFRDVVKSWPFKKERVLLSELGIRREDFRVLINYLVILPGFFERGSDDKPLDLVKVQRQADAYVDTFFSGIEGDTITWPMFDDAMRSLEVCTWVNLP